MHATISKLVNLLVFFKTVESYYFCELFIYAIPSWSMNFTFNNNNNNNFLYLYSAFSLTGPMCFTLKKVI